MEGNHIPPLHVPLKSFLWPWNPSSRLDESSGRPGRQVIGRPNIMRNPQRIALVDHVHYVSYRYIPESLDSVVGRSPPPFPPKLLFDTFTLWFPNPRFPNCTTVVHRFTLRPYYYLWSSLSCPETMISNSTKPLMVREAVALMHVKLWTQQSAYVLSCMYACTVPLTIQMLEF